MPISDPETLPADSPDATTEPSEYTTAVPAPAAAELVHQIAEGNTTTEPTDFGAAIAEEYGAYTAAGDCHYFGQVAIPSGGPIPARHPELRRWLDDGTAVPA